VLRPDDHQPAGYAKPRSAVHRDGAPVAAWSLLRQGAHASPGERAAAKPAAARRRLAPCGPRLGVLPEHAGAAAAAARAGQGLLARPVGHLRRRPWCALPAAPVLALQQVAQGLYKRAHRGGIAEVMLQCPPRCALKHAVAYACNVPSPASSVKAVWRAPRSDRRKRRACDSAARARRGAGPGPASGSAPPPGTLFRRRVTAAFA